MRRIEIQKRIRTISALLLGCVSALFAMAGCAPGKNEQPQEELCGDSIGAYFITDESYEEYVRE